MFDECLNKMCKVVVLTGARVFYRDAVYKGVLLSYDENYLVLKTKKGKVFIAIKYLVTLEVVE